MTEAGAFRLFVMIFFGFVCLFSLVCAGVIVHGMMRVYGVSVHGVVFTLIELLLGGVGAFIAWMAWRRA